MEGVGARLGRSSTRYGPPTIFTGPVRKWKKRWVHVSPSSAPSNNNNNHHSQTASNGNNGPNLLFYKWAPSSSLSNGNGNGNCNGVEKTPSKDDSVTEVDDEPPRRKFKYIPVAMLEEEKNEAAKLVEDDEVQPDDEVHPDDSEPGTAETTTSKSNDFDQKPDMNDVPMEETQTPGDQVERQDLNESTLDLSLA